MNKLLLNLLIFISFTTICKAQDFPFGKFTVEEMNQKTYKNDTSAHAFVLQEFGSTRIDASDDGVKTFFKYHVRIKYWTARPLIKALYTSPFMIAMIRMTRLPI
jgi:hypothetical protein